MGSPAEEKGHHLDERLHKVVIERPFAIGKYTVTFEEYDRFVRATRGNTPADEGWGRGRRPVINITWYDAVDYTEWLSGQTGRHYRLPTEAEWEYAARADTQTAFHFGDTISTDQANYGCVHGKTVEVGQFAANAWGLYDTHGNVWEWTGSESNGISWVLRGGSWGLDPQCVRAAARRSGLPGGCSHNRGFRLARDL